MMEASQKMKVRWLISEHNSIEALYTSEGMAQMDQLLDNVSFKVTGAMNDQLLKPVSSDEVKIALFQMFPIKALVPNRYVPELFFLEALG